MLTGGAGVKEIKLMYEQIREYIEEETVGKAPGDALKSEVSYSAMFKVSRPTIRKAVDELVASGIVKRLPGKGLTVGGQEESTEQSLKKLAILVPFTAGDGFFYELVMGCVSILNVHGCSYSIYNYNEMDIRKQALELIRKNVYSGVIMTAYDYEDYEFIEELKILRIPVVLVDNPMDVGDTPYVGSDDFSGGYMGTSYLIRHGHKKIVYITLRNDIKTTQLRLKGHLQALSDNSITLTEDYVIRLSKDDDIYDALSKLKVDYTAMSSYSDIPLIMACNYFMEKKIRIPSDVSLLGYGNCKASELLQSPLTTISIPVNEIGIRAAKMMINYFEGKTDFSNTVLAVNLVERDSVNYYQFI